jgi:cell division topological specificity factor
MIDLIRWALKRQERSKDEARQRLQVILVMDRIGLATDQMEAMKRDIIGAVSRYFVVDEDSVDMDMRRSDQSLVLVSNIHVKDVIRAFASR